jgi:hypothetical protein
MREQKNDGCYCIIGADEICARFLMTKNVIQSLADVNRADYSTFAKSLPGIFDAGWWMQAHVSSHKAT